MFVWGARLAADLADESRFAKHVGLGVANLRPVAGDGLFTAYNHEPNWQLAHDVLAPGFSREAMAGYHGMMLAVAGRLTDHWGPAAGGRAHGGRARGHDPADAGDDRPDRVRARLRLLRAGPAAPLRHGDGRHAHLRAAAEQRARAAGPAAAARRRARRNAADMDHLNRTVDGLVAAPAAVRRRRGGPAGPHAGDRASGDRREAVRGERPQNR
ncbi:hypothetical protein GCM10017687_74340 [Streptomyces echinatus]